MVAKKGSTIQHHFAHAAGSDCAASVETALHLAAKSIIESRRQIVLPAVEAKVYSTKYSELLATEQRYAIDRVELEPKVGSVVPDVLAHIRGHVIAIEIRVTHAVDERKAARLRSLGLSTVEIDLSSAPRSFAVEEIEPLIVDGGPHKKWIYNAVAERRRVDILSTGRVMKSVSRGFATHVDGCPIYARTWKGHSYANVVDDCVSCEHALEIGPNMSTVTCGASDISHQGRLFHSDG